MSISGLFLSEYIYCPGADPGFQVRGVFRVENHYFMPKNLIFSNFRGEGANARPPGSAPVVYINDNR